MFRLEMGLTYMKMINLCYVLLMVFATQCASGTEWKRLYHKTKAAMIPFEKSDYAFPVHENLVFCRKKIIRLHMNLVTADWGIPIQRALNELRESGGTVLLPEGTLWMRTQIEVPSYVCVKGAGMYKTIMRVHPDSPAYELAGTIRTAYTERVSFFDFTQDGNRHNLKGSGQNRFGIYTHLSNYVWMKNVRIMDNKWFGFDPHGANTAWSYYLVMEDCYSSGNGKDGFTIDQYYYVSMLNSVAKDNLRHGINVVSGSRYVLVKGNLIDGNRFCSLVAQNNEFGTGYVLFSSNHCRAYPLAGICLRGVFDVDVLNNYFSSQVRNGVPAFYLHNTWKVQLVRNSWIKGWRKAITPSSRYEEYETREVKNRAEEIAKFNLSFANMEAPLSPNVDLSIESYGKKNSFNRVPLKKSFKTWKQRKEIFKRSFGEGVDLLDEHRVYKRNNLLTADPKCEKGLRMDTICCPVECGECSEDKCMAKVERCCPEKIREDGSSCDTYSAPCILSRKYTSGADPECVHGVRRGQYCCNKSCKKCGGKGCKKRGPHGICCLGGVRKTRRKCKSTGAPCTITKAALTNSYSDKPDPECKHGILRGKYCCPKMCGACGGKGCEKRAPNKICCGSGVKKTRRKCKKTGAPCKISKKDKKSKKSKKGKKKKSKKSKKAKKRKRKSNSKKSRRRKSTTRSK